MKMSQDYLTVPVVTGYIRPGEGFSEIIERAGALAMDGDFLVISETPVSVAQGNLVDESRFRPSITAVMLADIWSKYIWGYLLGPILGMKRRTIMNLRRLPPEARAHKEVVLRYYGLKHALKPASEAGIDLSNVPGTLVSLLPENPGEAANFIASEIRRKFGADVTTVIIDTDATYSILGRYFTSLPIAVPGIRSDTGFLGYLAGRFAGRTCPHPSHHQGPLNWKFSSRLHQLQRNTTAGMPGGPRSMIWPGNSVTDQGISQWRCYPQLNTHRRLL